MKHFYVAVLAALLVIALIGCGGGSGSPTVKTSPYVGKTYVAKGLALGTTDTADLTLKVTGNSTVTGTLTIKAVAPVSIGSKPSQLKPAFDPGVYQGVGSFTGDSLGWRMTFANLLNSDASGKVPVLPATEGGNFTITVGGTTYGPFTFHIPATGQGKYSIDIILPLNGASYSSAVALNDSGTVVGSSDVNEGSHAFQWTKGGGTVDLGTLGGQYSSALDINNSGLIVGQFTPANGDLYHEHGFSGAAGALKDIGLPSGYTNNLIAGVTETGIIVGMSSVPSNSGTIKETTFAYQNGEFTEIGPESQSELLVFSHTGVVYGDVYPGSNPVSKHWKSTGGTKGTLMAESFWTDIGGFEHTPGGFCGPNGEIFARSKSKGTASIFPAGGGEISVGVDGQVSAMNANGEAVGTAFEQGFYWTSAGGVKYLNSMIDSGTGFTIISAHGINSKGQIICQATSSHFDSFYGVALLLTPPAK